VWDAASYYRHYESDWNTVASHCRSWVGPDGAECLVDLRMMFGCRAAANWAQRGTGFLTWVIQQAMDRVIPESPIIRKAFQVLHSEGVDHSQWRTSYTNGYIDDQPSLVVASMAPTLGAIQAAAWKMLGFQPQGKKVWPEGGFEST
jgi:hypothetical protein